MAKDYISGMMEESIKVNINMTRSMVMESILGLMGESTMAVGLMV